VKVDTEVGISELAESGIHSKCPVEGNHLTAVVDTASAAREDPAAVMPLWDIHHAKTSRSWFVNGQSGAHSLIALSLFATGLKGQYQKCPRTQHLAEKTESENLGIVVDHAGPTLLETDLCSDSIRGGGSVICSFASLLADKQGQAIDSKPVM
jgi:hypothetical protein